MPVSHGTQRDVLQHETYCCTTHAVRAGVQSASRLYTMVKAVPLLTQVRWVTIMRLLHRDSSESVEQLLSTSGESKINLLHTECQCPNAQDGSSNPYAGRVRRAISAPYI
eukprot:12638-Heterococcus_DN1.PRE.2